MSTTQEISTTSPIGRSTPRVDGPSKVSGRAQYTSDFHFPGMLYAVPVEATIANGRIVKLDTTAAEKIPGVRAIFHRENIGKIFRSVLEPGFEGICEERRPPFADDVVRYYGQYIAVAVADTFEAAKAAADAVRVTYDKEKTNVETELEADDDPEVILATFGLHRPLGKPARRCRCRIRERAGQNRSNLCHTGRDAQPDRAARDDRDLGTARQLTLYDSSQGVVNFRSVLAQMFGLPKENVRVITKFVGSGFGGKLFPWTHCALAAGAARQLGKPVKLVLSRKMMFQTVGHRPRTQQRVRLGATPDGKLVSLQHDYVYHRSMLDAPSRRLRRNYAVPIQRAQSAREVRTGQAQRRRSGRYARPRRRARPLCNRVGDE